MSENANQSGNSKFDFGNNKGVVNVSEGNMTVGNINIGSQPDNAQNHASQEQVPSRRIFISYRRAASQAFANHLYTALLDKKLRVFLDTSSIEPGSFPERLKEQIRDCDVFLLVIAKGTFERVRDPEDWVRREIELALSFQKLIIPVIEPGHPFPSREELPDSLRTVLDYTGKKFGYPIDDHVKDLIKFINT
jgi:hypothetical protein